MIVYGSRMYGRKNVVRGWGYCEHCGKYGKNTSCNARKWGHLYFIPLIPEGPRVRVIKDCAKCSNGVSIPESNVPDVLNDMRRTNESALAALGAGETQFNDDGTMTPCAEVLAGSIEALYCLNAADYADSILASLQEHNFTYAHQLALGELLEFKGNLDDAAEAYWKAAEAEPSDAYPLIAIGSTHMKRNDPAGAVPIYETALELSENRFPVLQILLSVYSMTNDHNKVVDTYEECFELVPELTQDKSVLKDYRKTCKKAGRDPAHK
ncbi:MAG: hypothetical protein CMJ49_03870 [Planctomycetaceae bacterium]|nr:hypothetical protein [Planctomycetaceae bacterium]